MKAIVAIDVGTTGTKAALVDERGRIISSQYTDYPTVAKESRVEQSAEDWWQAVCKTVGLLVAGNSGVEPVAISLSGQMQDVVLLGEDCVLAPVILYSDVRAQSEAQEIIQTIGEERLLQVTANLQDASSLLAKFLWLKRYQPELYHLSRKVLVGAHDFISWKMCGVLTTDYTTAATTGLLDFKANQWAYEILEELGLRSDFLPDLMPADAAVGGLSVEASEVTGLRQGIPVFHGAGDAAAATLGAGAGSSGTSYVYLGTSGWLAATCSGEPVCPRLGIFNLRHPNPGLLIQIGPMLTAAGNFEWLNRTFGALEAGLQSGGLSTYEILNIEAAKAPAGCRGLLYLPYLAGERAPFRDPNARGVYFGLSTTTTRQELYRAVLEGVAFSMKSIQSQLTAGAQSDIKAINLVGGGARSVLWAQIFADIFDCRVNVLADPGDVGARGAAIIAGKALGWFSSFDPGEHFFPVDASYTPRPATAEVYQRIFPVFTSLYPALKFSFEVNARSPPST